MYLVTRGWQEVGLGAGTVSVGTREAEGKGRAENLEFGDQSRRGSDHMVFKSPYLARMLSNPPSLPSRLLIFLPGQRASPLKLHSPGIGASGLEEHWK